MSKRINFGSLKLVGWFMLVGMVAGIIFRFLPDWLLLGLFILMVIHLVVEDKPEAKSPENSDPTEAVES